jgi:hypothetical protein
MHEEVGPQLEQEMREGAVAAHYLRFGIPPQRANDLPRPLNDVVERVTAGFRADLERILGRGLKISIAPEDQAPDLETDALRYRRLRVLGCAPDSWEGLERAEVLRFTNLDAFVDADLSATPTEAKGEARRAQCPSRSKTTERDTTRTNLPSG